MSEERVYIMSLIRENDKLKEEIKKLKEDISEMDNLRATYQIWNGDKKDRIEDALEKIYESKYSDVKNNEKWYKFLEELTKILKGE